MFKSIASKLGALSTTAKVVIGLVLFTAVGAAAVPNNNVSVNKVQESTQSPHVKAVTSKQVVETESLEFAKKTEDNASLPQGQTQLKTTGEKGVKTLTYEVTYTDGVETSRKLVKEEITKAPVDEVTYVGTYVAPTPVITTVPTQSYSSSAVPTNPTGATAKCRDGSLSYSAHRQGTCSHHGGVAIWY